MQPTLMRSRTDRMLAGVCGGLGDYFGIDSIIVRLIFVLVTLTSMVGLPVYLLLWVLMPKQRMVAASDGAPTVATSVPGSTLQPVAPPQQAAVDMRVMVAGGGPPQQHARVDVPGVPGVPGAVPPPEAYRYNPHTGQPVLQTPAVGATIRLDPAAAQVPPASVALPQQPQPQAQAGRKQCAPQQRARRLGFILIGVGALALLNQLGLSMSIIIPPLMIVAGVMLLKRNRILP